ncbi:MAG: hypothetical protein AAF682_07675 [Planctomycetota bacterium]
MSPSRENMLEAFKDVTKKKSTVGGPFAGAGGAGGGAPTGPGSPPPLGSSEVTLADLDATGGARLLVLGLASAGLGFVLGVVVGRGSAEEEATARAAERPALEEAGPEDPWGDSELDAVIPAPGLGEGGGGAAATEEGDVAPLFDPRNKYTIVAISISPTNEELAWDNYDHLRAYGLPAFPPFKTGNGMLVIVVGAAPKESDLHEVRNRLRRLAGPNGSGRPYEGAYPNPIRKLIPAGGD